MGRNSKNSSIFFFFSIYIAGTKDTHETSTYIHYLAAGMGTPVLPFDLLTISTTVFWFLHLFPFFKKNSWSLLILALEPHQEKKNPKQNKTKQKKTKITTQKKPQTLSPCPQNNQKASKGEESKRKITERLRNVANVKCCTFQRPNISETLSWFLLLSDLSWFLKDSKIKH